MKDFFFKKKDKPFYRFFKKWIREETIIDKSIELKNMTSMLTHCFIEMEHNSKFLKYSYLVDEQTYIIYKYTTGTINRDTVKAFYAEMMSYEN